MANRRERLATACALIFAFCVLGGAPLLRAQDTASGMTQQIGWELSTGNFRSALADARLAVQEFPESAILMHLLAVAESKNGLQEEARKSFQKSIRLDATIPQNYYDLALLDMQIGDYAEAAKMLRSFLGINPQSAKGHLMLGIAYRKQKNDALAVSPSLPLAHYNLGKIYASQGNNDAALDEYRDELGINPEFYDVYWSAAEAEIAVKQLDAAEALFRRAIKMKPLAYQAYFGLARLDLARKQLPKAEAELKMVIALDPGNIAAHALLASVYNQLGKTLEAKREELVVETLKSEADEAQGTPTPSH